MKPEEEDRLLHHYTQLIDQVEFHFKESNRLMAQLKADMLRDSPELYERFVATAEARRRSIQ